MKKGQMQVPWNRRCAVLSNNVLLCSEKIENWRTLDLQSEQNKSSVLKEYAIDWESNTCRNRKKKEKEERRDLLQENPGISNNCTLIHQKVE